jgi:hypothetical protein
MDVVEGGDRENSSGLDPVTTPVKPVRRERGS